MNYITKLIIQYKDLGILIDTNILLCYLIGMLNPKKIPVFKRTRQFGVEDFSMICSVLRHFRKIVTTPNVLTEVNSFSRQLKDPDRTKLSGILANHIKVLDEHYIESRIAAGRGEFAKLGLTDCGIIHLSPKKYLVLTDDFTLANYLSKNGVDVINFNHIRVAGWT
jgi:rRNA-processing protein FCF1